MTQIGLVSYAKCPELTDDDRLLIPAFARRGVRAVPVVWDAEVDWLQFERVVIRSCWDYHLRLREFLEWVEHLERLGVRLSNSARLIRWNAAKTYLKELNRRGVRIPPTVWIDGHEELDAVALLRTKGWPSAVAKPIVSASAHGLKRVFADQPTSIRGPAMVQPFLSEVPDLGEWSLVFIGGEYSHAVLKRAAPGEFRVQSEYGGETTEAGPVPSMVGTARKILASLDEWPDYARVDGILCGDEFVLMELELIEPVLFLKLGRAADRFAEAILNAG
jgi:hypothetical protein